MMKRIFIAASLLVILCGLAQAQQTPSRAKDEAAIRAIIATLADAWTRGDADAWGRAFTVDGEPLTMLRR